MKRFSFKKKLSVRKYTSPKRKNSAKRSRSKSKVKKYLEKIKTRSPIKQCTPPFFQYDTKNRLYSIEDLINKLKICNIKTDIYERKNLELIEQFKTIIDNFMKCIDSGKINFINLRDRCNFLLTTQLKGKDFQLYSNRVEKLCDIVPSSGGLADQQNIQFKEFLIFCKNLNKNIINVVYTLKSYLYYETDFNQERDDIDDYIEKYYELYEDIKWEFKIKSSFYDKVIEKGNPKEFTVKAGSIFYKGITDKSKSGLKDNFWLAYDLNNSINYMIPSGKNLNNIADLCSNIGVILIYKLKKDIKLPNMENYQTVLEIGSKLKNSYSINTLNTAFRVSNNKVYRNSYLADDYELVLSLCELGYQGYTAYNFETKFYPELFLCQPYDLLEYIGYYDKPELDLHFCKPEYSKLSIM